MKWLVGVDEAGRGPFAGPVSVGAVMVREDFDWTLFADVRDSKVLSEKKRDAIAERAKEAVEKGMLSYHVALISATYINTHNIVQAVHAGIAECFTTLNPDPHATEVKLDGLLKAPQEFTVQETIIKGDALEPVISLASVMAKTARDAYMCEIHSQYPKYNFAQHKGYGTKEHRMQIQKHGLSPEHRVVYCKNCLKR